MKIKIIKGPLFEERKKQAYKLLFRAIHKKMMEDTTKEGAFLRNESNNHQRT